MADRCFHYGGMALRDPRFRGSRIGLLAEPVTARRLANASAAERDQTGAQRDRLDEARRDNRRLERLMARIRSKLIVVQVKDVIVFESEDKIVFARTPQGPVLNTTMKELEERLDPDLFCRVHKQAIVQLSHAREVHSLAGGHYLLRLDDGTEVQIGRNYSREFRARFG